MTPINPVKFCFTCLRLADACPDGFCADCHTKGVSFEACCVLDRLHVVTRARVRYRHKLREQAAP